VVLIVHDDTLRFVHVRSLLRWYVVEKWTYTHAREKREKTDGNNLRRKKPGEYDVPPVGVRESAAGAFYVASVRRELRTKYFPETRKTMSSRPRRNSYTSVRKNARVRYVSRSQHGIRARARKRLRGSLRIELPGGDTFDW